MAQRRFITACLALMAILLLAGPVMAAGAKSFAVLPFNYNGPQKYAYFPKALQASLESDLEWLGQVEPTTKDISSVALPSNKADALNSLRGLGIDHLVYGDISILGKKAHIKMEVVSEDGKSWMQKGEMGLDEITAWLDNQSKTVQGDVFNRPGYGTAEKEAKKVAEADKPASPMSSAFIPADGGAYKEANLNPQFRYEGGTETSGRWRSQAMRFSSYGMYITDGDADGQNEVFILQKSAISAYRFKQGKLQHLSTFDLPANVMSLRLEVADLNKDGMPEFIVGGYQFEAKYGMKAPNGKPRSSILSFEGGKFKYIVKKYDKFLGILRIPPTYMPILVAQKKGQRYLFDKYIYEAFVKGDSVSIGQKLQAPPFGNVYNMTYLPQELGYNYVVLDNKRHLVTYSQTLERLNQSDPTYNSSGVVIPTADKMLGMGPGVTEERIMHYNIPFRMVTAPLTSNKYELLVNKDLSASAQVFSSYHYYTQGEVHSLAWDGVGMNLAWKTRRIKGQVSDVALADLNNDGNKQLCVLVNTFAGIGYSNRKTVVIAYDLNL